MEIEVVEKKDDSIKFRVKGGSQSVLNLLKEEANEVPGITFAGFVMEHPLERSSVFMMKTDGKDAEKLFKKVLDKTDEDIKNAKKQLLDLF